MSDRGFVGAPVEIVTGYLTVAKIKIKNPRYVFGDGEKKKNVNYIPDEREKGVCGKMCRSRTPCGTP